MGFSHKIDLLSAGSLDFIVNSHVLEHVCDPIGKLLMWLKRNKNGGHLIMAIPEMTKTFDRDRTPSTWDEVLEAARVGDDSDRDMHVH